MLTRYQIALEADRPVRLTPEWGYRLYSALLEQAPADFSRRVHEDGVTPVSQFLMGGQRPVWTVSLLGEACETELAPLLAGLKELSLEREGLQLNVVDRVCDRVEDVENLFRMAKDSSGCRRLHIHTPAAFKSRGQYQTLPTPELLVGNLVRRWNGCITECPIEDTDGEGVAALAAGLRWREFSLHSGVYRLKGNPVPGFTGVLEVERKLSGFHSQLADALLLFSAYSGIGIKTALGMGGVTVE